MKQPFVPVTIALVAGILTGWLVPLQPIPLLILSVAVCLVTAFAFPQSRPLRITALFLAGSAACTFQSQPISPYDVRIHFDETPRLVKLRGVIRSDSHERIFSTEGVTRIKSLIWLDAKEVQTKGVWQPLSGKLVASLPVALPADFNPGTEVELTGVLQLPRGAPAPGLFNYREHLKYRGVHRVLRTESVADWKVITPSARPGLLKFVDWGRKTLAQGLPVEDENLHLMWAMALGWNTGLTGEVSEPFMRSGTMHVFAVSGLHIALIAAGLVAVLRLLTISRQRCAWVAIPLLWFYTGATGWQPSAIRSAIMATVMIAGWALPRPADVLNSLFTSAFIILLWDPLQLFQASFQLSFLVVLALVSVSPVLEQLREDWLARDPLIPEAHEPRWRKRVRFIVKGCTAGFIISTASWLGSLPLIAAYFHMITPGSLFANLIVVPLSDFCLGCCAASLLVTSWFPALGELLNHSAWFWMECMVRVSLWFAHRPGSFSYVAPITLTQAAGFYGALLGLVLWFRRPEWRGKTLALLITLCASLGLGDRWLASRENRLTVLNVGGGDALLVDLPGTRNDLLVDCGDDRAVEFLTVPFLRSQGIGQLPALAATHGDVKHIGGAVRLVQELEPREVFIGSHESRSPYQKYLTGYLSDRKHDAVRKRRGDQIGAWTVLNPDRDSKFSAGDDAALVLRSEIGGVRVLCLSDLGPRGANALLNLKQPLHADILIAGMPDRGEALPEELLAAISPRAIIVSTGEYPSSQRAPMKLRQRLARRKIPVYFTEDSGAVTIKLNNGKVGLTPQVGEQCVLQVKP